MSPMIIHNTLYPLTVWWLVYHLALLSSLKKGKLVYYSQFIKTVPIMLLMKIIAHHCRTRSALHLATVFGFKTKFLPCIIVLICMIMQESPSKLS